MSNQSRHELLKLRQDIDQLDQQLITLLAERMRIVKKVGQWKKEHNVAPLDQTRWQEVTKSRQQQAQLHQLDTVLITEIFESIHQSALRIERQQ